MAFHRFKVSSVNELHRDKLLFQSSEILPLIDIIPPAPSLPTSFTSINETNKTPMRLFNSVLERLKIGSSTADLSHKVDSPGHHSHSITNLTVAGESEGGDSCYSTIHSNNFDTNPLHFNNKFLHELRSKRREFRDKAKNLSIDQRIALNRCQYHRDILRAQDIFAVHFALNDNDTVQNDLFTEETQERIRNNIFDELDRQRMRQLHKQHRQLVVGRALLMFIVSLLVFMSLTLIYVVMNLYDRAKDLDTKLVDNEFVPMTNDQTSDV